MVRKRAVAAIGGLVCAISFYSCTDMDDFRTDTGSKIGSDEFGVNFVQDAYIKASNAGEGDTFGASVDYDGTTLVVSAPYEASNYTSVINADDTADADDSAYSKGAIYVFRQRTDGNWYQDAYIKTPGKRSGYPVRVKGDLIVVRSSIATANYVCLYRRDSGGNWNYESTLDADDWIAGMSLAIGSDFVAVGLPCESSASTSIFNTDNTKPSDTASVSSGAVAIYKKNSSGWYLDAFIKPSTNVPNSGFGNALSADGQRLVVGSFDLVPSVYVYACDSTGDWHEEAKITPPNPDPVDWFGWSISLEGDDLAVSAPWDDSGAKSCINNGSSISTDNTIKDSGAVYLYHRTSGVWNQTAYLKPSNNNGPMQFGSKVQLDGRFLAVSAYVENNRFAGIINQPGTAVEDASSYHSGAVYIFERDTSRGWIQRSYVKPSNSEASQEFGKGIAMKNGTLAVGCEYERSSSHGIINIRGTASNDSSLFGVGAVYIFSNR